MLKSLVILAMSLQLNIVWTPGVKDLIMPIFDNDSFDNHEQVVFCNDKQTGLRAIIAIHDTTLGPALGGTRLWNYANEAEALTDVLRLSRGMTYKASVAGLNLGGGKAVIIGDPKKIKTRELFNAYGRFVDSLNGRYITAEDVNIRVDDMKYISEETEYLAGGPTGSGDPSPVTALGVFHGIRAAVQHKLGVSKLSGLKIAIQGCGSVGSHLCHYLAEENAKLYISDVAPEKLTPLVRECGAEIIPLDKIHAIDADVFSPCALGAILNDKTIPEIKAKVIAGGANNQLLNEDLHSKMLKDRGILHAPDYVINAGGLINCYQELVGYDRDQALDKTKNIYTSLIEIFKNAEKQGITTIKASNQLAESRINQSKTRSRLRNGLKDQPWYDRVQVSSVGQ